MVEKVFGALNLKTKTSDQFWPDEIQNEVEVESKSVDQVIVESLKLINENEDPKSDEDFSCQDDDVDDRADETYIPESETSDSDSDEKHVSFQSDLVPQEVPIAGPCDQETPRSRKRKRDPSQWQRNVRHRRRVKGESYVTRRGKRVPQKGPKPVNCLNCRFKCSTLFNEDERKRICGEYYALADNARQKDFLCKRVKVLKVHRHRSRHNKSKKNKSCEYSFVKHCSEYRVCKKFFQSTLNIGHSAITTAITSIDSSGNFSGDDGTPAKTPGNKIKPERIANVKTHITSFEPVESHYCRKQTKAHYRQCDLTISKMYDLYVNDFCSRMAINDPVSSSKYREVFLNDFNLRFLRPKRINVPYALAIIMQ
ncbi:hypothetical protein LOTGIDRAFT_155680 [Lottia gigantea]|uniref:Uncharacterized protein n=1 Tax=Lottia gigantea TaxID=225164 RepID=V3ZJV7_LOTGI|nr:hypothetical protein LOTGIDRAFT_155680 [Lottia gigantea]ESO82665.1 hypothetical protein LOTGIDRAFT_155680 [Lottia gigantea]